MSLALPDKSLSAAGATVPGFGHGRRRGPLASLAATFLRNSSIAPEFVPEAAGVRVAGALDGAAAVGANNDAAAGGAITAAGATGKVVVAVAAVPRNDQPEPTLLPTPMGIEENDTCCAGAAGAGA